jgi:membrane protein implicated in regulation of membrane protease activity
VKRLRWEPPDHDRPVPKHPYRDTALLYGVLAVLVVVIAFATGGSVKSAVITAALVFLVATLWSWRTWRNRLREEREKKEERTQ